MLVPIQVKPVARGRSSNSAGVRPNFSVSAGVKPNWSKCVVGHYHDGRVCLSLPKPIGSRCIDTPGPDGTFDVKCCGTVTMFPPNARVCCDIPVIGKICKSLW